MRHRASRVAPLVWSRPFASLSLVAACALAGCSKKPADSPTTLSAPRPAVTPGAIGLEPKLPYDPLAATLVTKIPEGAFGPYITTRESGGLVVVAAPVTGEPLAWLAMPLGADGVPKAKLGRAAAAPSGLQSTTVRPLGRSGYLLVWSRASDRGQLVETLALGDDGATIGQPQTIYQGTDAVLWADAVTTADGAHLYVTTANGREGRVQVAALDARGAPKAPGLQIAAPSALAWQPVAVGAGSMLATVQTKEQGNPYGRVMATPIAADGKPGAAEIVVPSGADVDLDAAALGDRVVVGFTDHSASDGRVHLVSLDLQGKPLGPPRAPMTSAGDQALLGLAVSSGADPSLLATWEDLAARGLGKRRVQLASFRADGSTPKGRATLELATSDESVPAVSGAPDGFATLSLGRACLGENPACDEARVLPTYVRWGNDLTVKATSPLLLEPMRGDPPDLVWGLSCTGRACVSIATDTQTPTSAYVAALEVSKDAWRAPGKRAPDAGSLAITNVSTALEGPRLGAIAGAKLGAADLVASVTDYLEGTPPPPLPKDVDARAEAEKDRAVARDPKHGTPRGGVASVTSIDASGASKTTTLSVRAFSPGGVAIASDAAGKEAAVAWVARDAGDPELFVTRVGEGGKKLAQQEITHVKGDVTDVAIAAADDGFLVAWVDSRDGDGEVYAARLNKNLQKQGPEQRLTKAKGDASDVEILVQGKEARVAFVDPRSSENGASEDVYVARIKTADASKIGDEVRVSANQHAPRSLRFVPASDGAVLFWLDGDITGQDRRVTMQSVFLDASGKPRALPAPIDLGDLSPTSLAVSCNKDRCRLVVTHATGNTTSLAATTFREGETPVPHDLLPLFAGPGVDVSPTLLGGVLYVADENGGREGRLRRMTVSWPP